MFSLYNDFLNVILPSERGGILTEDLFLEEKTLRQEEISKFKEQFAEFLNEGSTLKKSMKLNHISIKFRCKTEDEEVIFQNIPKEKRLKGKSLRFKSSYVALK